MTSTTFFIIFIPILAILLLAINLILAPHNPYQEKDSAFECGFNSFLGQNRTQFSISFFIFGLLFLLFDLEILLVYPYSVSSYTNDAYGLVIMLIFFVLLGLGFVFELGKNALTIDSRQTSYNDEDVSTQHALASSNGPQSTDNTLITVLMNSFRTFHREMPNASQMRQIANDNPQQLMEKSAQNAAAMDIHIFFIDGHIQGARATGNQEGHDLRALVQELIRMRREGRQLIQEETQSALRQLGVDPRTFVLNYLPLFVIGECEFIFIAFSTLFKLFSNKDVRYIWSIYYNIYKDRMNLIYKNKIDIIYKNRINLIYTTLLLIITFFSILLLFTCY